MLLLNFFPSFYYETKQNNTPQNQNQNLRFCIYYCFTKESKKGASKSVEEFKEGSKNLEKKKKRKIIFFTWAWLKY